MNTDPRQAVCELIVTRGPALCGDIGRCEGFLRDHCPHERGKVNVLVNALKERVVADLLSRTDSVPIELLIGRLAKRLEEHHAIREDMALWAVETWALALEKSRKPCVMPKPTMQASFKNSLGMTMLWCPPGEFLMGRISGGKWCINKNEVEVRISQGFWLASTPLTQGQWQALQALQALVGSNPSQFRGSRDLPVENVSWDDAQEFCTKLNAEQSVPSGYRYALPSEAQWEYACRAGDEGPYSGGNLAEVGWYEDNSKGQTHEVGHKKSNAWGLHDMRGNVMEWCADWYECLLKAGVDPKGPQSGNERVCRGGSWSDVASRCRAACRLRRHPANRCNFLGFRPALVPSR